MTRCAIYIRVSKEEQVLHGYSLEAQKELLVNYAQENNLLIVDYYEDEGLTARKKLANRKEFQRMISDVKGGKIDLIIFTKLDRWFRNISDYYKTQEVLEEFNVNWKTILESYDTSTASGRLHINIMLSVAQDEADRTSERIKVVFDNKVKNGEAITGAVLPGYKIENKKIVIDKKMEATIRDTFDYFELHNSIKDTMRYINAKYNTEFNYGTMHRILRKSQYCGKYRTNANYCEPYISVERYNKLQRLISINQRSRQTKRNYIFSGLLICSQCKKKLAGTTIRNKVGTLYRHYVCYNAKINQLCSNHLYMGEKKLEAYLLDNIENEIEKFIYHAEVEQVKQPVVDNSKEIYRKLDRLKDLYINEKITMEEYSSDYDRIKSELIVIDNTDKTNIQDLKNFLNSGFRLVYNNLDDTQKQTVWRSIIKEIVIDGRKVKSINFI